MRTDRRGFTLIELLVVISIIGLLSSIVVASLNSARKRAGVASGQEFNGHIRRGFSDDLVLSFNFDDTSGGAVVYDESENRINGTKGATAQYDTDTPTNSGNSMNTWGSGGGSGYVQVTCTPALTCPINVSNASTVNPSNNITISFWVKRLGPGTGTPRIFYKPSTGLPSQWDFQEGLSASFKYKIEGPFNQLQDTGVKLTDEWIHIAVSYDSVTGIATVYKNGAIAATNMRTANADLAISANPLFIGASNAGTSNRFNGKIDDFRIFRRSLVASEVQKIYALGAPTHQLAQHYK
jgi:prepilin-type N-terminal cleavage/methylation domain-containing protein